MKDSIWFAWHTEARMWKAAAAMTVPALAVGGVIGVVGQSFLKGWGL